MFTIDQDLAMLVYILLLHMEACLLCEKAGSVDN
jgi:hypothetical protein